MSYAILGGGISGLAAAFYLRNCGVTSKIIVIEGSNRIGGWINSHRNENDTLFELGPRTLRVSGNAGANTICLAETLKLEEKIIPITYKHPSARNRFVKVNNKLHKLPSSIKAAFSKSSPFSKPLAHQVLKELIRPSVHSPDESFYSFAQRRFGSEFATYIADPMCRGIYAGNAKDLSVMAISKMIYQIEQRYNSVIKGIVLGRKFAEKRDPALNSFMVNLSKKERWSVWSLQGGLQTLVEALQNELLRSDVEIIKETKITEIKVDGNKSVITTDKGSYIADKTISCLPAFALKHLVKEWNPSLYTILNGIPYVSVGLVNLEYEGNIINEPAFGYLVPSSESPKVLGVIYDSCNFPQSGKTVLTVMMGGYWFKELFGENPTEDLFLQTATEEIRSTFNISVEPINYKVSILRNCIPQYSVGHYERVEFAKKLLHGLPFYLAGNSYEGVGVNDAIYGSKKIVHSILGL